MTSSCPRSFPRPSRHHQDLGRRSHPSHFASTAPYPPASTSVDRNAKACPLHSCSQLTLSGWQIPVTWMYGRQYRTPKHAEEDWSSSACFGVLYCRPYIQVTGIFQPERVNCEHEWRGHAFAFRSTEVEAGR